MKVSDLSIHNVQEAVAAAEAFLERCPTYDGSALSANLLFERHATTGRPLTPEAFEFSFNELKNEGLIGLDYSTDNSYNDLLQPVCDERECEEPEDETDVIEYVWHDEPQPTREDFEGLSTSELRKLIRQHDEQSAPEKSLNEQIQSLTTAQLGQLITKVSKR